MDLALEQGEVEKRIQAVQDEVKKHDDAIKELQKKLKVLHSCVRKSHMNNYFLIKCRLLHTGSNSIIPQFPF